MPKKCKRTHDKNTQKMVSENSIKESESSHLGCISYRYFCIIYYFYGQSESHHRSNEKTSRKCSPKAWESIFKPLPIFNICEQQVLLPWPSKQCFPLTNKSLVHSLGTSTSTAVTIESEKKCPYFSIVSETQCAPVLLSRLWNITPWDFHPNWKV